MTSPAGKRLPRTKRALVLGGGGLLGAMFQIEALDLLEKHDPRQTEFDLDGLMDFRAAERFLASQAQAVVAWLVRTFTPINELVSAHHELGANRCQDR